VENTQNTLMLSLSWIVRAMLKSAAFLLYGILLLVVSAARSRIVSCCVRVCMYVQLRAYCMCVCVGKCARVCVYVCVCVFVRLCCMCV
jgi:uncharacterized membrane protein